MDTTSPRSQDDQTSASPHAPAPLPPKPAHKRALLPSALLLLLPALIPVAFATQADDGFAVAFLLVTALIILVANTLLLLVLSRWFKRMARDPGDAP